MTLAGKKVALAVTGGIAAYKSLELIRLLRKSGAEVRAAMSANAGQFVTELSLATLTEAPVTTSLFEGLEQRGTRHIDLARWCDVLLVCPATANVIGKTASGIADDFITTTILATEARVIFCPAMNSVMWENRAVQDNVKRLQALGYSVIEPEFGDLATSGEGQGLGRLASLNVMLDRVKHILTATDELAGVSVVITGGPTREALDPVRFISNRSSGRMGIALADAAHRRGAEVTLISGPNQLPKPQGIKYIEITTVDELQTAIESVYEDAQILIMSAAVSDYKPTSESQQKLKKRGSGLTLELTPTQDILAELGKRKGTRIHVGFALETENGEQNARKKLERKNLDLIVLNDPNQEGAAFDGDTNVVTLFARDGAVIQLPKLSKYEVAERILNSVQERLPGQNREAATG